MLANFSRERISLSAVHHVEVAYLNGAAMLFHMAKHPRCIYQILLFLQIILFALTTVQLAGTLFVTTAFAPIIQPSDILQSPRTLAPAPIITLFPIVGLPPESLETNNNTIIDSAILAYSGSRINCNISIMHQR